MRRMIKEIKILKKSFLRKKEELVFGFKEKITGYENEKKRFKEKTGYELDLKNPQSFNQKIVWKKIYDRNPLLPIVADKYQVREYLKNVLGEKEANKILIPLLYVTDKPETIPFDYLPREFVIKANHGSGSNIIVEDKDKIDREEVIAKCNKWLRNQYGFFKHEWAYQKIKRKIVIEELLRDEKGELPKDYKFHIFHGKCAMVQVNQGHFNDKKNRTLTLYKPDWSKINVFWVFESADYIERPQNLNQLKILAEKLSEPFDYVRVDLYSLNGNEIYFGEFTNYPTSGSAKVVPQSFDFDLGKHWKLEKNYWKK